MDPAAKIFEEAAVGAKIWTKLADYDDWYESSDGTPPLGPSEATVVYREPQGNAIRVKAQIDGTNWMLDVTVDTGKHMVLWHSIYRREGRP